MAACLEPYIRKNEDPTEILRLDELIAEGSFGTVYKGVYTPTSETVAVKIIQLEEDETFEDLVIEIEVLTRCTHENIVGYFGSWRKAEELFIAMEYCDGGSAADLYQELNRPLEEREIQLICRDTLRGIQYLHSVGILHRDIKGANILIKTNGSVKLVDFGVCGKVTPQQPTRRTFIGTPYWMAPEVIENKGAPNPYDGRCDVWSLGITLIELAHAEPPLSELHPMKALFQIPYRTPPTLSKPQGWSPLFNDFVAQSLTRDPRQRPTVAQLLAHPWVQSVCPYAVLGALVQMYLAAKRQHEAAEEADALEEVTDEERKAGELLKHVELTKPARPQPSSSAAAVRAVDARIPSPPPAVPAAAAAAAGAAGDEPPLPLVPSPQGGAPQPQQPHYSMPMIAGGDLAPGTARSRAGSGDAAATPPQQRAMPSPSPQPHVREGSTGGSGNGNGVQSPSQGRPQQAAPGKGQRPKTVHRTTARRTAEIKKNISKKLVRQHLAEIKAQQKVQQKELEALQGRQGEQKGRINRFYAGRAQAEGQRRQRDEEQAGKRVAGERESEVRRFRSETEQLQKQQSAGMRQWQKDCGVAQKAAQRAFGEQLGERTRELKEHERFSEKESRSLDKRLREQVRIEQKIARQQEETEAAAAFGDAQELQRLCDEHAQQLHHKDEAQALILEQQAQHQSAESHERTAAVQRQIDGVRDAGAVGAEGRAKANEYEEEAVRQLHALLKEQLQQRHATEWEQHKRQQLVDMRDFVKELREAQKRQLAEFTAQQTRQLRDASGDRKQLKQDQKADKDEFMRGITRREAESQQAKKRLMDEEEAELRDHMATTAQKLAEAQDAELLQLRERNAQALEQLRADTTRAAEELEARLCRERLALLQAHQEEQFRLRLKLQEERLAAVAEFQRQELQAMTEKQAAALALLSGHHTQKLDCMHSLHTVQQQLRVKELKKARQPEGEVNALVQMQQKEFERTRTGFAAAQQSLSEEQAAQHAELVAKHKQRVQDDIDAASKHMADLRRVQEQILQRAKQEVAVILGNHKFIKVIEGL